MFQKEFCQRLLCKTGDPLYCRLTVNTQLLANVSHVLKVSKNSFKPPPKVDSAVVRIEPKHIQNNTAGNVNFVEWDGLMRILFQRKNKTINSLFNNKHILQLLDNNYNTYCKLNNIICWPVTINIGNGITDNDELNDATTQHEIERIKYQKSSALAEMIQDELKLKTSIDNYNVYVDVDNIKSLIAVLLKYICKMDILRPAKLSENDFLFLLATFNQHNIHFVGTADLAEMRDVE